MGIYNALFTGSSGLSAFGEAVRVIGDNIANVNTLGFKAQNVVFADVLSQTVGVARSNIANQVGNGVRIGQITRDTSQGSIQNTTSATDMAINGRGMFALRDPASDETYFSRAGAFFLDKDFNLIDGQGFVAQGWALDEKTQNAIGNITDISFSNLAAQAKATDVVNVGVSLDSNAVSIPGSTAVGAPLTSTPNVTAENASITAAAAVITLAGGTAADIAAVTTAIGGANNVVSGAANYVAGATAAAGALTAGIFTSGNISATELQAAKDAAQAAVTGASQKATFNPEDPATYNYKSEVNVYDSLGQKNSVSVYYVKTSANNWNWYAGVDASAIALTNTAGDAATFDSFGTPVTAGSAFIGSYGSISFGANGELVNETLAASNTNAAIPGVTNFTWKGATPSTIGFNMGSATTADVQGTSVGDGGQTGQGLDGVVQMAGAYATRQMVVNGFPAGFLDRLETDSTGRIFGVFTNGQRRGIYQVALANFPNDSVLTNVGSNLKQETIASGTPVFEKPGNGGMGSITPYGLEQSNVDLAGEFVKLIVVQRGYEANSKTIMTTDQMLSSLMQIKR